MSYRARQVVATLSIVEKMIENLPRFPIRCASYYPDMPSPQFAMIVDRMTMRPGGWRTYGELDSALLRQLNTARKRRRHRSERVVVSADQASREARKKNQSRRRS